MRKLIALAAALGLLGAASLTPVYAASGNDAMAQATTNSSMTTKPTHKKTIHHKKKKTHKTIAHKKVRHHKKTAHKKVRHLKNIAHKKVRHHKKTAHKKATHKKTMHKKVTKKKPVKKSGLILYRVAA